MNNYPYDMVVITLLYHTNMHFSQKTMQMNHSKLGRMEEDGNSDHTLSREKLDGITDHWTGKE